MKKTALFAVAGLLMSSAVFGLGGGGIYWGESTIVPRSIIDADLRNTDAQFTYTGGYGYGVDSYGQRTGGFGVIISSSESSPEELFGAFGGGITGTQMRMGPVTASLNLMMGIGGFGGSMVPRGGGLSILGEANAEIGVRVLGFMQVSLFAGLQGISRVGMPQRMYDSFVYAPVVGTRLTWGSF
ncbi:MAG: hypothetical protein ACOCVC_05990 [Spirochaeta sp.]